MEYELRRTLNCTNLLLCAVLNEAWDVAQHVRLQRWLAQTFEFVVHLSGQPAGGFQMGLRHNWSEALHTMYQVYNQCKKANTIVTMKHTLKIFKCEAGELNY